MGVICLLLLGPFFYIQTTFLYFFANDGSVDTTIFYKKSLPMKTWKKITQKRGITIHFSIFYLTALSFSFKWKSDFVSWKSPSQNLIKRTFILSCQHNFLFFISFNFYPSENVDLCGLSYNNCTHFHYKLNSIEWWENFTICFRQVRSKQ